MSDILAGGVSDILAGGRFWLLVIPRLVDLPGLPGWGMRRVDVKGRAMGERFICQCSRRASISHCELEGGSTSHAGTI